jgi:hypothetical protein
MTANTTEAMLEAFLTIIWRRGCPRIVFSDRGGNLLSQLAHKVYERLGIEKVSASAYRHNASGLCERAIQSLLALLSCSLAGEERHATWIDRLPSVLWTLNSSVCAGTGYSQF